jgi:Ser/Thr protein kinase RdoA (MazF antagonist)
MEETRKIIDQFDIDGNLIEVKSISNGNINKTYVATFKNEDGSFKKYLVQRINTSVFTEPYKLMKNIEGITSYLKRKMRKDGDSTHRVLEVVKTKDNKTLCYIDNEGKRDYYRVYEFIENAVTYNYSTDEHIVFHTGAAFGNFQKSLTEYPMNRLHETIPDFHNTTKRYKKLIDDIKIDPEGRVMDVANEIVFILMREDICPMIMDLLGTDKVPYRVTHNDTKVNNVMMNAETGEYMAVIDLDTVMPGSLLFDYGDGIRSTASTAAEDETDLNKVELNLQLFEAYTRGYLSEMAPYITEEELDLMGESIRIITLELAIRFLNDYINGDTYFKTNYPKHNLDRARNQLKLVQDIELKLDYINQYIYDCYYEYKKQDGPVLKLK